MRLGIATLCAVAVLLPALAAADVDAGFAAYKSGDYETALKEWQPLAEAGDARAQFGLGALYADGFGVPMDDVQALDWFGRAAEQGNANAQYRLGVMHQNGWGVPMSDESASGWYQKAAEQGFTQAQVALGQVYAASYSALFDPVKAYQWFAVAMELDDIDGKVKLEEIAPQLSPEQTEQAKQLTNEWLQAHRARTAD